MAVKGLGYTKTTWAFEERPVASSKLNTWDDRIEGSLELIYLVLNQAWGGGDGVITGATTHDLEVTQAATPGMYATVAPGYAFISKFPFKLAASTDTPAVTAPVTHPRIDLVQAVLSTWNLDISHGTEATSPVAPNADTGTIALAKLYLRPGMTSIKTTDDGVNGYIIDDRTML